MGKTIIRKPASTVFSFLQDTKSRVVWDKVKVSNHPRFLLHLLIQILNEHKIVDEFTRDSQHRTFLWTNKFRPRYLKIKRRVTIFAWYALTWKRREEDVRGKTNKTTTKQLRRSTSITPWSIYCQHAKRYIFFSAYT